MIKRAKTRVKLLLEVEERLPYKDLQDSEQGTTQKGQSILKKE
jgi:hypothetical protein